MRMFRLRTLAGSNVAGLLLGGAVFSQFFLLTLYMQQVLHYSALQTGVAYIVLTLAVIVFANVSQVLALRIGIRPVLPVGLLLVAAGLVLYARLPVDGHYFWDLFPPFLLSGIGMALAFVPMTIGALEGVRDSDAGIASGLINTGQQIGGAIGVAAATTVAATYTSRYVDAHPGGAPGAALTHGFEIAFYVLAAIAVLAVVASALLIESRPPLAEAEEGPEEVVLEAAA
jgi:MFS family permease